MTTVSEARELRSIYSTVLKDLWGGMREEEKSPHTPLPISFPSLESVSNMDGEVHTQSDGDDQTVARDHV
jgi:hypothetical protein